MDIIVICFVIVWIFNLYTNGIKKRNEIDYYEIEGIENLENNKFCLYLRNFRDDKLNPGLGTGINSLFGQKRLSYEDDIVNRFKNKLEIIKVHSPISNEDKSPTPRIKVDNNWKTCVTKLIKEAKYIIIQPSTSSGLLWEISHLFKSGYINKTIFIWSFDDYDVPTYKKIVKERFFDFLLKNHNVKYSSKGFLKWFIIENNRVKFCTSFKRALKIIDKNLVK